MAKTLSEQLERADELREQLLEVIERLSLETLAKKIAHDDDDEAILPASGSPGARFLGGCRDAYLAWVRDERRFPTEDEAGDAAGRWHRQEAFPTQAAQAVVDLGLFYSAHNMVTSAVTVHDFLLLLDAAAAQFVITLTEEYGPLV